MKKKVLGVVAAVIVLVAVGFALMVQRNSKLPAVAKDCAVGVTSIAYVPQKAFLPACVKVPAGTTITYTNQSDGTLEVGADPHPIHTGDKQVSGGKFTLDIKSGESATVKLDKKGMFGLHDHENSSARALIVVE